MNVRESLDVAPVPGVFKRSIHLLYVPTLNCNLSCSYCYLGEQTSQASLKTDAARAVDTLRHTLAALEQAGVLAFNVSLHGGEVTTLPPAVLEELFVLIHAHYLRHFDAITALGHRTSRPIFSSLRRSTNASCATKSRSAPASTCRSNCTRVIG
jgi:organic radical activating enzyme